MRRPIAVAAALTAILLYITTLGALSADEDALTTTLHPGWNLIGWIHEETPAADLFEQLDSLESVHDGSGQSMRRPAADAPAAEDAALTLQPGRGYWLRIGSEQPLDWTRPAEPSTLRFQLEPGNQLVAWAGPSDRSIDDVLLGLRDQLSLAWRWIAAEQRYVPWSPNLDIPSTETPPLNRGDAVRIDLLEPTEWLHPTGDLPRIQFAGGLHHQLPDNFREMVEADLRLVVERFAAKFQFEAPADRLILRVPTTPAALQRQQENMNAISDAWAFSPKTGGGTSIIVMPWYLWQRTADRLKPSLGILAHEYFHVMQYEFAGPARSEAPGWLVEGTAGWSGVILFDAPQLDLDQIQDISGTLDLWTRSDAGDYDHYLGNVATRFLARRAGVESLINFWRNLDPRVHPNRTWQIAFAKSFDITFADFAVEFYEYRRRLFTVVSGRVETVDDISLSSLYVRATGGAGSPTAAVVHNVAPDGMFTLTVYRGEPTSTDSYWHDLVIGSTETNCQAEVLPDGAVGWLGADDNPPKRTLVADAEAIDDFDIELPAAFCQRRIVVDLTGRYGERGDYFVDYCVANKWRCRPMVRTDDDEFMAFVPVAGRYVVSILDRTTGCLAYATADGASRHVAAAHVFLVEEELTLVRVPLESRSDICSWD